jgi:hypothetical protein
MLDLRTESFLGLLKNLCPHGGYMVASIDDFSSTEFSSISESELEEMLTRLSVMGYISLRFFEGDEFCCSVLQKGHEYRPVVNKKTGFFARNKAFVATAVIVLVTSFLGAFLAGLLA